MRRWEEAVIHIMVTEHHVCAGDTAVSMTDEVPASWVSYSGEGHRQYTHK